MVKYDILDFVLILEHVYGYVCICSIYENALKLFYFRIFLLLICSKFVVIFFFYLFIYFMHVF